MKRIAISTLGCKVNQFESASFRSQFEKAGHTIVGDKEDADIVVINTCTVTASAGSQSRQIIRKMIRRNPDAKLVITGCHAQLAAQELIEIIDGSVCIIGNGNKDRLVEAALCSKPCDMTLLMGQISHKKEISRLPVQRFANRTRAYLRVQDGCNSFCSYCIVPYTRGPSRSLPVNEVLEQAETFVAAGHLEIVVTGIHVGLYGRDLSENNDLVSLLEALYRQLPQTRFRLSSIEPMELSSRLLDLMAEYDNFMPHFHIPLQSGNDDILAKMNRRYSTADFAEVVENCRKRFPEAALGIDLLAGFPGEGEKEFDSCCDFLETLDFSYLHVFPFSARPGTIAAAMTDQVDKATRHERVARLRELSQQKSSTFFHRFIGQSRPVLVESVRDGNGRLKGFSDNYIPVSFQGDDELMNSIVQVRITDVDGQVALGERA
ncbi:MAG: tRNA (N(6)-L-threonylcarbamoyladenosine(37)-C(2))-methylthiotransferase MtaB [Thermodesulfobacteriota bacterium]